MVKKYPGDYGLVVSFEDFLGEKRYIPSDEEGSRERGKNFAVGILKEREPLKYRVLGLFNVAQRRRALFLGCLQFNEKILKTKRSAIPNKRWVLDVYGTDNVQKLTRLVKEFRGKSKIELVVSLESREVKFERLCWDNKDFPSLVDVLDRMGYVDDGAYV